MMLYSLIPGLPLAAFVLLALSGKYFRETSHRIAVPAVALSFGLSLAALAEVLTSGPISIPLYPLINAGGLVIDVGLYIDQLTVVLLPLVTGVSLLVYVYSSRYMIGDERYRRFFAVMALFTFAMAMLVMSDNLLVTYMCWELMGICSYLLISHWAERRSAGRAATKAFLVNAVADVGLGFGVVLTFVTYGTLNIQEILAGAAAISGEHLNLLGFEIERNTVIVLCLLSGAMGKSAQVPMHVWLPYAMEAPTPVSALIHAATMVNAGPFLLVRLSPLVMLAPAAMVVIAVIGAVTALYGALVSLTQSDIKKLLAYSTISQIGFMIFACGVGAFSAAVFHLLAHGFLKAFLFLSTGNALVAAGAHAHGDQSLGEGRSTSLLAWSSLLAVLPPIILFSGPYEAIWASQGTTSARVTFWVVGIATVFLTGAYTMRTILTLFGSAVGGSVRALPRLLSPRHLPWIAIAIAAAGAFLLVAWRWYGGFLAAALADGAWETPGVSVSPWLLLPVTAALLGVAWMYLRNTKLHVTPLASRGWAKAAYVHFLNKLYFDELHHACAVQPTLRLSRWLLHDFDLRWINRTVAGTAQVTRLASEALHSYVDASIDGMWEGLGRLAASVGGVLQRFEPRALSRILVIVVSWLVLAISLSYWLAL